MRLARLLDDRLDLLHGLGSGWSLGFGRHRLGFGGTRLGFRVPNHGLGFFLDTWLSTCDVPQSRCKQREASCRCSWCRLACGCTAHEGDTSTCDADQKNSEAETYMVGSCSACTHKNCTQYTGRTAHLDALWRGLWPVVHLDHSGWQVLDVPGVVVDALDGDALGRVCGAPAQQMNSLSRHSRECGVSKVDAGDSAHHSYLWLSTEHRCWLCQCGCAM